MVVESKFAKLLVEDLQKLGAFRGKTNSNVERLSNVIDKKIPRPMRIQVALYGITSLVNNFSLKGALTEDDVFPIATIYFILAHSGAKKTSSVRNIEKALGGGYDIIDGIREDIKAMKEKAIGEELPPLEKIHVSPSTVTGLVRLINAFKSEGIGVPTLFADEIATELAINPDIITNIQLIAQLYDAGNFDPKILKDKKQQSEAVTGMAMPAMFMGSEHQLLEDKDVLKKFMDEFMSKLARRSFFCYPTFDISSSEEEDTVEYLLQKKRLKRERESLSKVCSEYSAEVIDFIYSQDIAVLKFTDQAVTMVDLYEGLCEERSLEVADAMVSLEMLHRHWKVTKLAVALAAFDKKRIVDEMAVAEAITYAEEIDGDISKFLYKSSREAHEIITDHFIEKASPMSFHELVKGGLIKKIDEVNDLVILANASGKYKGKIEVRGTEIIGTAFTSSELIKVSYTATPNFEKLYDMNCESFPNLTEKECAKKAKETIANHCANSKIENFEYSFEDCANLLKLDLAFAVTHFENEKRSSANIKGTTNLICLDIDDTDIPINEIPSVLADYNFHVARTSDENNPLKYRILMKSDIDIDIKTPEYKNLLINIGEMLGLKPDSFGRDQLIYGYGGREVLTSMDGQDLEVSKLIQKSVEMPKEFKGGKKTQKQLEGIYDNRRTFFHYAYDIARGGNQIHSKLYMFFRHMHNIGFNYQMNEEMFNEALATCDNTKAGFVADINRQRKRIYGKE